MGTASGCAIGSLGPPSTEAPLEPSLNPGVLVAIEGIDGAGKTTQANLLRNALRDHLPVVLTKQPSNGVYGERLRQTALTGRLPPLAELALFLVDRGEHVQSVVEPGLARGAIVILDRYYYSTVAYQGARGLDPDDLLTMNRAIAPPPDLLIVLDVDPQVGLDRVASRGDKADHFEDLEALATARGIFDAIDEPFAVHIDSEQPIADVQRAIRDALLHGALLRRLCPIVREEGADRCGHTAEEACEWLALSELLRSEESVDRDDHGHDATDPRETRDGNAAEAS